MVLPYHGLLIHHPPPHLTGMVWPPNLLPPSTPTPGTIPPGRPTPPPFIVCHRRSPRTIHGTTDDLLGTISGNVSCSPPPLPQAHLPCWWAWVDQSPKRLSANNKTEYQNIWNKGTNTPMQWKQETALGPNMLTS